ncbi:MAG: DUF302 domain-containing protein [Phycisphaerales bacterium]|nr:DUF302 domain-containing protein [Phycisphaerales bacterium]
MLYTRESTRTVKETGERIAAAAADHKFGVLGVHDLRQKMADKGVRYDHECLVYEVCSPQQAKKVLDAEPSISTALPCRISVYEENGKVLVATLKPTMLLEMFGQPSLAPVAQEVEQAIESIIDTACE